MLDRSGRVLKIKGELFPAIFLLTVILLGYLLLEIEVTNSFFPGLLFLICIWSAYRLINRQILMLWSPIVWFLLASAVFYGIGPLIYKFGTSESIEYIESYYPVGSYQFLRTNILNTISIILILVAFEASLRIKNNITPFGKSHLSPNYKKQLLFLFLIIGYSAHTIIFIIKFLQGPEVVMPGILFILAELTKVSVLIAVYLYVSGDKTILIPMLLISGFELYMAVASLMKQYILEVLMMIFLGYFMVKPSKKVLFKAILAAVLIYLIITPFTNVGRNLFWEDHVQNANVFSLLSALADDETMRKDIITLQNSQSWWIRLSSFNAQAFAMDAYDNGQSGKTFHNALFVFIPRFIWPDKPIMTQGHEFTKLVKGAEIGGGTGPGFFGEAYWNFGWIGVIFMGLLVGFIYGMFTLINLSEIARYDLRWVPMAFLSLKMGYRLEDWFITTIIGTIPFMVALWMIIYSRFNITVGIAKV